MEDAVGAASENDILRGFNCSPQELEAEPIETISAHPLMKRKLKEVDRDARAIY